MYNGYNLSQTVGIAASPEAEFYRKKLDEWTSVLRNSDDNRYERIYMDLKKSQKELACSIALSRSGELCTCIGLATALTTPMLPALGALGFAVTVIGGLCLSADKAIKFRNRWAMFGKG